MENVIESLRQLCNECNGSKTSKYYNGSPFIARSLDPFRSEQFRYGIIEMSKLITSGFVDVYDQAVDGAKFEVNRFKAASVRSIGTQGLSKYSCGIDPSKLEAINFELSQRTTRLYIHREMCMLNHIGSKLHDMISSNGARYISDSDGLHDVASNTDLATDIIILDAVEIAKEIDNTILLGNAVRDSDGTVIHSTGVKHPHFDGMFKMGLLQYKATVYPAIDIQPRPLVGEDAYFVMYNGAVIDVVNDLDSIASSIDSIKFDTDGSSPFSSDKIGDVIRVTSSNPDEIFYGDDKLKVMYSVDGTIGGCDSFEPAKIVNSPMDFYAAPCMFENEAINDANFTQYISNVMQQYYQKLSELSATGDYNDIENLEIQIICDPNIIANKDFAELREMCSCQNFDKKHDRINQLFPEFIPIKGLQGTNLWVISPKGNQVFLTSNKGLPQVKADYDGKCDKVYSKVDMLGGLIVLDWNLTAMNVLGTNFENSLTAPLQPDNLPHLKANTGIFSGNHVAASAVITNVAEDNNTIALSANTDNLNASVVSYTWKVYVSGLSEPLTPSTQSKNIEIEEVEEATINSITLITLSVETSTGVIYEVTIPKDKIIK